METQYIALIVVLALILIAVTFAANLRAKYAAVFKAYADAAAGLKNDSDFADFRPSIGPWALALTAEHPWLARLIVPNPISQHGANFLIRMINLRADFLAAHPQCLYAACDDPAAKKSTIDPSTNQPMARATYYLTGCDTKSTSTCNWEESTNLLNDRKGNFGLSKDSLLVEAAANGTGRLLALPTLYKSGLEQYVRDSDAAGDSVFADYDSLFALKDVPPPPPPSKKDACKGMVPSIASGAISMGFMGVMMGPVGAIAGIVAGGVTSALNESDCF